MINSLKVVALGECMIEFAPAGEGLFRRACAGDSFNSAVYLARQFSPAIAVSYMTGLGEDASSALIRHALLDEGISDETIISVKDRAPGLYLIENDESGERFFQYWRSQSAARSMFDGWTAVQIAERLAGFDLLYLTGISLAILDPDQRANLLDAIAQLQGRLQVAFDPNFRPALWPDHDLCRQSYQRVAALCDYALVTLDDHAALWPDQSAEEAGQSWLGWGASEVVVKEGGSHCLIMAGEESLSVAPPLRLSPVDTTGAGDSFAAGYLGARLLGQGRQQAAQLAHSIAAQVIMHPGGVIEKANWQRVEEEPTS